MRHYLETLNSQQTILLYITTLLIHLSTLWICQWSSGKDHKKLYQATERMDLLQSCTTTRWLQEISSKELLATAGSSAHFSS